MDCKFCGTTEMQGKFCNECGNPLISPPKVCRGCGNSELIGNYCHECGLKIGWNTACPSCGTPDQVGSFCKVCGVSLSKQSPVLDGKSAIGINGDFDRGRVFCTECGDYGARFRSPGVLVDYCQLCGKESTYLDFDR